MKVWIRCFECGRVGEEEEFEKPFEEMDLVECFKVSEKGEEIRRCPECGEEDELDELEDQEINEMIREEKDQED